MLNMLNRPKYACMESWPRDTKGKTSPENDVL